MAVRSHGGTHLEQNTTNRPRPDPIRGGPLETGHRLSLVVDYAPTDPETAPHTIANAEAALYALAQLVLGELVASVTLDQPLEGRDALTAS
jgi:hypothetical protein